MDSFFNPTTVAVVGASNDTRKLGGRLVHFLQKNGFCGKIVPVNPKDETIQGLAAYRSLASVPFRIDLAVLVAPAQAMSAIIDDVIAAGIDSVIVMSAGFAEAGPEGKAIQDDLVRRLTAASVRLIGPNSLGLISPSARLYISFSTALESITIRSGSVALVTQSGGVGSAIYSDLSAMPVGFSAIASLGNEADIGVSDTVNYFADDPETKVIAIVVENITSLTDIIDAVTRALRGGKEVVLLACGKSQAGSAAAATHTGKSISEPNFLFSALAALGVPVFFSPTEFNNYVYFLDTVLRKSADRRPVRGRGQDKNYCVLTISGGMGVITSDAMEAAGVAPVVLSEDDLGEIRRLSPNFQGVNPIDLTAGAVADYGVFGRIGDYLFTNTSCSNLVIIIGNTSLSTDAFAPVLDELKAFIKRWKQKNIFLIAPERTGTRRIASEEGLIVFADPYAIARVIEVRASSTDGRSEASGGITVAAARAGAGEAEREETGAAGDLDYLRDDLAFSLLRNHGIATPRYVVLDADGRHDRTSTSAHATNVLKLIATGLIHKTEYGAVRVNVGRDSIETALIEFETKREDLLSQGFKDTQIMIMEQIKFDIELFVSVVRSHDGIIFANISLGGIFADVLGDKYTICLSFSDETIVSQLDRWKFSFLFSGFRSSVRIDRDRMKEFLLKLRQILVQNPDRDIIELNPTVFVNGDFMPLDAVIGSRQPISLN